MSVHDNNSSGYSELNSDQKKALKVELADYIRLHFSAPEENAKCFAAAAAMGAAVQNQNKFEFKKLYRKSAKSDFLIRPDFKEDSLSESCEEISIGSELDRRLNELDESFQSMLLRKIDESRMKDSDCYKRANISKQLFSKIRSNPDYRPKKPTVIAFAVALELDIDETEEMLRKAGFSLSYSSKFDVIIRFFVNKGIYDVSVINEFLYEYDQVLLGSD